MAYNIAVSPEPRAPHNDPRIAEDSHCAYSHKMPVQYLNDPIADNSTYYFKVYMDLTLLERISVQLAVDLLFAENPASVRPVALRNSSPSTATGRLSTPTTAC